MDIVNFCLIFGERFTVAVPYGEPEFPVLVEVGNGYLRVDVGEGFVGI